MQPPPHNKQEASNTSIINAPKPDPEYLETVRGAITVLINSYMRNNNISVQNSNTPNRRYRVSHQQVTDILNYVKNKMLKYNERLLIGVDPDNPKEMRHIDRIWKAKAIELIDSEFELDTRRQRRWFRRELQPFVPKIASRFSKRKV